MNTIKTHKPEKTILNYSIKNEFQQIRRFYQFDVDSNSY